jgi:hypothetical protein
LFSGAHTAFVLTAVKFITILKPSVNGGRYINLVSGFAEPREGEKPPAKITIYLNRTEEEFWACVLHV